MSITYSKSQANKLIHYYQPLLLGESLYPAESIPISFLGLEPALRQSYQVYAYGINDSGRKVKRAIHRVAKDYGHTSPLEIAKYLTLMNSFE